ncbi:MAG: hypothetical protein GW892_19670 [Armatimonadetes bacterium]|nr:hypothetical protein [Armatimonadota bacterium]NCO89710.1 hypothetical protein [Armatimonadota bacterium]
MLHALFFGIAAFAATTAHAQNDLIALSDCETTDQWGNVELIDDAKVGKHAVRYRVPAKAPAGPTLGHGHANVDWAKGGELRFWYRFSGIGKSSLMIKLVAYPFADGYQATWWVSQERDADGQWLRVRARRAQLPAAVRGTAGSGPAGLQSARVQRLRDSQRPRASSVLRVRACPLR